MIRVHPMCSEEVATGRTYLYLRCFWRARYRCLVSLSTSHSRRRFPQYSYSATWGRRGATVSDSLAT